MSIEQNKAVIDRLNIEVMNRKNTDAVDTIFSPDVVFYQSGRPVIQGREAFRQWLSDSDRSTWGNWQVDIGETVAEGDLVVVRWTIRGTHVGEWRGVAPTGKPITLTGMNMYRVVGGKVTTSWGEENWLEVMDQIRATGERTMSLEEKKAVVYRLNAEIWNQKNADAVDEIFAPDVVIYRSGRPVVQGSETLRQWVANYARNTWGDSQATIEEMVAEGDLVITRWIVRGTHAGEWRGIAPTGKPVAISGITIHRVVGGKIAEAWAEEDWLGVMQQIGALPTPA
ncbi:MAG: ester cyclase [Caldilineaceae bacterium]|nr:ester cyclase [Caldilineaceae bacterium]